MPFEKSSRLYKKKGRLRKALQALEENSAKKH